MAKNKKLSFYSKQRGRKSFLPPGSVKIEPTENDAKTEITLIQYEENFFEERLLSNINELDDFDFNQHISWINIEGKLSTEIIEKIGLKFNIHPLTLEDISNTDQRPKFEDYQHYVVVMMKMLYYDTSMHSEQLSILLFDKLVISFQESQQSNVFNILSKRIRESKGRVKRFGADYLFYSLIDTVVDSYFNILDSIGDRIEIIDEQIMSNPKPDTINYIHFLKREIIFLRKSVWSVRDMVGSVERSDTHLIKETTDLYLRDVQDHAVRVVETVENYRDLINGMMDIYLSTLSNKMNEVMKILTIISTLFIPLTFIVGVYGMNFDDMPELHHPWGYTSVWIVMISIMIGLISYFRKKKWL